MGDPIRHPQRRKRRRSCIDPTAGNCTPRRHARFERLEDRRMLDAAPQLVLDISQAGAVHSPNRLLRLAIPPTFLPPITSTALNYGGPTGPPLRHVDPADVATMIGALTNMSAYQAQQQLSTTPMY